MNSRFEAVVSIAISPVNPELPAKANRPPLSIVSATPPIMETEEPELRRSELTESGLARMYVPVEKSCAAERAMFWPATKDVVCSEALSRRRILVPVLAAAAAESAVTKPAPRPAISVSPIIHGMMDLLVVSVAPVCPTKAKLVLLLTVAIPAPAAEPKPSARMSKEELTLRVTAPCVKFNCWEASASRVRMVLPPSMVRRPVVVSVVVAPAPPRILNSPPR